MHDAIYFARARITCALEYLTCARTALPSKTLTDSAVAIDSAQIALRQALRDLPDGTVVAGQKLREPRQLLESVLLDRGRPTQSSAAALDLDLSF
jgi:hypothetical protein